MIIDCHTHLNSYHEERLVSLEESLEKLLATMEGNGIDAALVLTSYKVTPHRPPTRDVVRAVEQLKNVFVVAGVSYSTYKERDLGELAEFLADGNVQGIKLYPACEPFYPWDKRCQVVYDLCMEYRVPVMIPSGDTFTPAGKVKYAHPLEIDEVAVDNPDLDIVICHLGNPWFRDCMEVVYKNPRVYADISGLVLGDSDSKFERWLKAQIEEVLLFAFEPRYQPALRRGRRPVPLVLYVEPVDRSLRRLRVEQVRALLYAVYRRVYRVRFPFVWLRSEGCCRVSPRGAG